MAEETDTALVARALRGEAAAREELANRYLSAAYAVALAVTRNTPDAEDIAQEAFTVALQELHDCRDPNRFAPWLLSVVRNRALNYVEKNKTRGALVGDAVVSPVAAELPNVPLRHRLLAALERLSPTQREVVLLHDLESWTHLEIASALEISETMSRQHLFVSRRLLREFLAEVPKKETRHG